MGEPYRPPTVEFDEHGNPSFPAPPKPSPDAWLTFLIAYDDMPIGSGQKDICPSCANDPSTTLAKLLSGEKEAREPGHVVPIQPGPRH